MMTHLESELNQLKMEIVSMWQLVSSQLSKAIKALKENDKDLGEEVVSSEKRVNAFELKIDRDCENIFALYSPVAIDLRFVLAVLKINHNLERIGDIAEGIAKFAINNENTFDENLLESSGILIMFEESGKLVDDVLMAFEDENTELARKIFKRDKALDKINRKANTIIADYIRSNPDKVEEALYILSTIRKLERVGDQVKNIAEEIIFYLEAKVLKHNSKLKKKDSRDQ